MLPSSPQNATRREELPPIPQLATRGQLSCVIHQLDLFRGDKWGNRRQPNLFERTSVSLDGMASWRRRSAGAHLAVELGLLLQAKVLGGVGHDGEGGFWIVPEWKEENRGSAW